MLRKSQTMVIDFNTNIEQKAPSGRPFKVVGTTKLPSPTSMVFTIGFCKSNT